jgi:hypothetical protein
MVLTDEQIKKLIKHPVNSEAISKAIELQGDASVHFTGQGYERLISRLASHETEQEYKGKRELSEPVTKPICNTIYNEITQTIHTGTRIQYPEFGKSNTEKEQFLKTISKIYNNKSLHEFSKEWLSSAFFYRMNDFIVITRPKKAGNEVLIKGIPVKADEAPERYIITVGIDVVHDYVKSGDKVEYLIYKYKTDGKKQLFRVIDDEKDCIYIREGENIYLNTINGNDDVITHTVMPCMQVGRIYSDIGNTNVCKSFIDSTIPLLRRYLKFDAINVISEVKHSFPFWWAVGTPCDNNECDDGYVIKEGTKTICPVCNGTKHRSTIRPGQVFLIPQVAVNESRPFANQPAGVVEGSVTTIQNQKQRLIDRKEEIYQYALGMQPFQQIQRTATEVELNTKPLEYRNNLLSSFCEQIESWVCDVVGSEMKSYKGCTIAYSKRLFNRNENVVIDDIKKAKDNGSPQSYIYSLVEELIYARYNNDPLERERQLILMQLEPLVGYTVAEVSAMPVSENTKLTKILFNDIVEAYGYINDISTTYKNATSKEAFKQQFMQFATNYILTQKEKQNEEN